MRWPNADHHPPRGGGRSKAGEKGTACSWSSLMSATLCGRPVPSSKPMGRNPGRRRSRSGCVWPCNRRGRSRDGDYFGAPVNRWPGCGPRPTAARSALPATHELVRDALPPGRRPPRPGRAPPARPGAGPSRSSNCCTPTCPPTSRRCARCTALPNNLPLQLTASSGGRQEMAEVKAAAGDDPPADPHRRRAARGKTRLSLQVAADLLEAYGDGVWLVELAAAGRSRRWCRRRSPTALGVREEPGSPSCKRWSTCLRREAPAAAAGQLRAPAGRLRGAGRSLARRLPRRPHPGDQPRGAGHRGRADVPRARRCPCPIPKARGVPKALFRSEAVRLFVERARLVSPPSPSPTTTRPRSPQVCRRLDGIPLAIELAAARVRVLAVEQIRRAAGRPLPPADRRQPDGPAPPADPARPDRLELRSARRSASRPCCAACPSSRAAGRWKPPRRSATRGDIDGVGSAGPADEPGGQVAGRLRRGRARPASRATACWRRCASTPPTSSARRAKMRRRVTATVTGSFVWPKKPKRGRKGRSRLHGWIAWKSSMETCGPPWIGALPKAAMRWGTRRWACVLLRR